MKTKKEYPVVKAEWSVVMEPEFDLDFECPYCKNTVYDYQIGLGEGEAYNKLCECPYCAKKFKLKVKEKW